MATFTNQSKNTSTFTNLSKTSTSTYYFLLDVVYFLLIDNTYKFIIEGNEGGWNNQIKN